MEKDQVTPPLPDRIAAAIDAYAQKSVVCGSRYETGPIAARTALCALIAEVVAERDAATKRADGLDEKWARAIAEALMTTFHPRADNSVEVWAAHVRREHDAHTRKDDLFRKACNDRDAARTDLAAAQAKLAEAVQLLSYCRPRVQSYEECNETYCADGQDHEIRKRIEAFLAAAEQGGAQ
jgi:hypothetical protein